MTYDTPILNTLGVAAGVLLGIDGHKIQDEGQQTFKDSSTELEAEW